MQCPNVLRNIALVLSIVSALPVHATSPSTPKKSDPIQVPSLDPIRSKVIVSPDILPTASKRPKIFLGGSIEMGVARNWQTEVISALAEEEVTIFNPRRADWNPAWKPISSDAHFRQQVEWELTALESADIIVMYLAPGTQSPISLLELGLYARSTKLILLCPEGFWRKGNVDITAERYEIQQVSSFEALITALKGAINDHRK